MKLSKTGIVIGIILVCVILFLLNFGFSDFYRNDYELYQTKPWRPWCRLIFSIIIAPRMMACVRFLEKL